MFIVMIIFGAITGQTGIVKNANDCSCYCFPMIGNVLPNAYARDQVSMYNYYTLKTIMHIVPAAYWSICLQCSEVASGIQHHSRDKLLCRFHCTGRHLLHDPKNDQELERQLW